MDKKVNFERKRKIDELKSKIRNATNNARMWVYNNKELIIVLGPAVLGTMTKTVKVVGKRRNLKREDNLKNLYCYDRSLGHYWKLRRELTNDEWVLIDRRKKNGERLADILDELKVLK